MFQAQPARPAGIYHAEFKAGKMDWDGKKVTADKRKGKIVLWTSEDEQLTHFQWHDREKSEVVLDLIVINDAYLEKIEKVKDGRVYLLRFTSSDKKLFFWMQEPKEEVDIDNIKKFNEAIGATPVTKPATPAAAAPGGAAANPLAAGGDAEVDPALRAILTQFLNNQGGQAARSPPIPLGAVLTTEVLQSLMTDEAAIAEMVGLMPEGQQSKEDLQGALASPQLQQAMSSLSQAVHSDQLPVLFSSLGLSPSLITQSPPGTDALEVLARGLETSLGEGPAPAPGGAGNGAPPAPEGGSS